MNGFSQLIGILKGAQADIALSLANGNANSYEVYQRLVGEYRGLEQALKAIDQLLTEEEYD
ncbi:MAG: hypothetical protein EBR82_28760 [Caulobacteraceae bacterium]|jgi:hypothetical protein|nr:hypothetical protein [Caulobacteraceae bacterium]